MKKILITIAIASFISLGFTLIEDKTNNQSNVTPAETVQSQDFEKTDIPVKKNDNRLANWD